jgi:hypothetical protein
MVLALNFPTNNEVGVTHGDQVTGPACYMAKMREARRKEKGKGVDKSVCIQVTED